MDIALESLEKHSKWMKFMYSWGHKYPRLHSRLVKANRACNSFVASMTK